MKSVFVANMSHEIRTPLGAILGFADVLKESDCSPQDRLLAVDAIDRNGTILLRLIEDILDISKIEAGKMEVEVSKTALRSALTEVVALFEAKANAKGLVLELKMDVDVPEHINTDAVRLRQI